MRVCIIGGGISGLVSIKSCLEEGLEPVCFEKTNDIAGLWRFREEDDGEACVMRTTVCNTSKEIMALSDFPPNAEYPNFMHNKHVQQYIRDYAENFKLKKYIRFGRTVELVEPREDFERSGEWNVTSKNVKTEEKTTEVFGGVMVCIGHHARPNIADFPGLSDFKGVVFHTHSYRDCTGDNFKDKRVVVVGVGNSGGDLAVELSRVAKQVLLSTRRGTWVFNRVGDNGIPADMLMNRRAFYALTNLLPDSMVNAAVRKHVNQRFNHRLYSLEPEHGPTHAHPTMNDELPNRIICGSVKVKADVEKFTEKDVHFKDGSVEEDIDVVIMATGYRFEFPFLSKSVTRVENNRVSLYKLVFPPSDGPHTLAFVGFVQPSGAVQPISEGQSRWAARVFSGLTRMPKKSVMEKEVAKRQADMQSRYVASPRHTIQVDCIPYMDEIHDEFGAKPNMTLLWLTDPRLAYHLTFGPSVPYQYRLRGPHAWKNARETILTVDERMRRPLETRPVTARETKTDGSGGWKLAMMVTAGVVLALVTVVPRK